MNAYVYLVQRCFCGYRIIFHPPFRHFPDLIGLYGPIATSQEREVVTNASYIHLGTVPIFTDPKWMLLFAQMCRCARRCRACVGPINQEPLVTIVFLEDVRLPNVAMIDWERSRVHHLDVVIRNGDQGAREETHHQGLEYADDRVKGLDTRFRDCIHPHWRHRNIW